MTNLAVLGTSLAALGTDLAELGRALRPALEEAPTDGAGLGWGLGWIDLVGLSLVGLFTVLGVVRGLWWQVVRLLGIVLAVALARGLTPRWSPWVQARLPDLSPHFAYGLAWFVLFVVALVVASLLGLIGKRSLEAMQLGPLDRLGGALAGLATGALAHAALLVALCAFAAPQWSQDALRGTHSQELLHTLAGRAHLVLDARAAEHLEPWFRRPDAADEPPAAGEAPYADEPKPRVR